MTRPLAISVVQMNELPRIDDVGVISEEDEACLHEIREVLERHKKLSRFGIALLHRHFDMDSGEVLLEQCDESTRTLVAKPVGRTALKATEATPTVWRFDAGSGKTGSRYCQIDQFRRHVSKHPGISE